MESVVPETLREDMLLSGNRFMWGVLVCPRKLLWVPTLQAIIFGFPGLALKALHTLDPPWLPTPGITQ